ncbi:MAG: end-binding protein Ku [Actinomycetota bacterium]|jgi:DNA end-binding protein Ku|nr:end-binding protein Ku [Actinomycetota bacterium]
MPSSIWTGAISFGLVQVPVKLVGATKSKDVSFNQLEEGTGARIRYRKVSDKTGDEVTADKIVRGFEVSKGKYVIVEPSEIDSLRPKGSHEIEIEEFVDLDDIDPLYFEQPYYLVPDKRGEKPYALLLDAMKSLNKVAIGRIVMRSKERLVAIRPVDGALCVETMRYADEVLPADQIAPEGDVKLSEKERTMARQLVESLAVESFEPEKYHDLYREQLLDLIARKESGEEIVAEPHTEPPAKVLDLVAALEASIAKSKTAKDRHPSGTGSHSATATKPGAGKRATKSTAKAAKAPAKKAARAKRSA